MDSKKTTDLIWDLLSFCRHMTTAAVIIWMEVTDLCTNSRAALRAAAGTIFALLKLVVCSDEAQLLLWRQTFSGLHRTLSNCTMAQLVVSDYRQTWKSTNNLQQSAHRQSNHWAVFGEEPSLNSVSPPGITDNQLGNTHFPLAMLYHAQYIYFYIQYIFAFFIKTVTVNQKNAM